MFENSHCAATYFVSDRRYYMDYKKEIIEMVEKMESVRFLAMIYSFAHTLFEKEKKQGD